MAPLYISSTELHGYQLFARFLIDAFFFVRNFKILPTIFYKTIKKWKFTLITANLWAATCRQIDNTLSYWRPYREQTLYSVSFRKGHFITIVRPSEINLLINTDFNPNTYRTRWPLSSINNCMGHISNQTNHQYPATIRYWECDDFFARKKVCVKLLSRHESFYSAHYYILSAKSPQNHRKITWSDHR